MKYINKPLSSQFWVGSLCRCRSFNEVDEKSDPVLSYPSGVVGSSDIIRICEDLGNNMPANSWMLYLLELFGRSSAGNGRIPIELNLICQLMIIITFGPFLEELIDTNLPR